MSFSKNTISWYGTYLAGVRFTVKVANQIPNVANISRDVPQGSMLDPLLFFIYVNDMSQAVESNLYLYPDDSCLPSRYKEVTKVENSLPKSLAISLIGL